MVIAIVIGFVVVGLVACGYVIKKKKDKKDPNFVFETYKDYQDFGSMKQGKTGVNYSETNLASSAENSMGT